MRQILSRKWQEKNPTDPNMVRLPEINVLPPEVKVGRVRLNFYRVRPNHPAHEEENRMHPTKVRAASREIGTKKRRIFIFSGGGTTDVPPLGVNWAQKIHFPAARCGGLNKRNIQEIPCPT